MFLPAEFENNMTQLLGTEWAELKSALTEGTPSRGCRLHRFASQPQLQPTAPLAVQQPVAEIPPEIVAELRKPILWYTGGYYIPQDSQLGRSVYHESGSLYLQEPSAMAAVTALAPQPGETVLDLCAAPGGKTTAIGQRLAGRGVLVANEIHPTRVVTLAQNIERLGIPALIVNESPAKLAARWPGQFDALLIDAPCSGEGMFRKDEKARSEWTAAGPSQCAARQREILAEAVKLLKVGGRFVYSTCTFNPEENEQIIAWLLNHFPVRVLPLPDWPEWETGRPEFADGQVDLRQTRRMWPHRGNGEGHFIALLQVIGAITGDANDVTHKHPQGMTRRPQKHGQRPLSQRESRSATSFIQQDKMQAELKTWLPGFPDFYAPAQIIGNYVYLPAAPNLPLDGLKVLRVGMCLATLHSSGRMEPHHQLAMALAHSQAVNQIDLSLEDAARYIAGETLDVPPGAATGYAWLHTADIPIGWGKVVPGRINNLYPKGLRKRTRECPQR